MKRGQLTSASVSKSCSRSGCSASVNVLIIYTRSHPMKLRLVPLLRCPSCRHTLRLEAREVRSDDVLAGSLDCEGCGKSYAVDAGIPRLLAASAHEVERR